MTIILTVEDEQVFDKHRKIFMFTLATIIQRYRFSLTRERIFPCLPKMRALQEHRQSSPFGNKGQLQALAMGEVSSDADIRGKETPAKVTSKDVFWVPELPLGLPSTGEEVVDYRRKESCHRFRSDRTKYRPNR